MKHKTIIIACALAVFFVIVPNIIDTSISADEAHWIHLAEDVRTKGLTSFDSGVATPSTTIPNLFTLLLSVASLLGNNGWIFIQAILAVLAVLFIYNIAFPAKDTILFVMLISPLFFDSFSSVSDNGLYLVLMLLSIWLFQSQWWLFGIVPLMLTSARSPVDLVMMFMLVVVVGVTFKRRRQMITGAVMLIPSVLLHLFVYSPRFRIGSDSVLNAIFFEFGSTGGISIVLMLLCAVAIYVLWRSRTRLSVVAVVLLVCTVYSVFDGRALVYLSAMVVALAGISLDFLRDRKWTLPRVKVLFFTMVFTLLVFNGVSAATHSESTPVALQSALTKLANQETGTVLTHYSYADMVSLRTGMPVLLIPRTENVENAKQVNLDMLQIFHSSDPDTTKTLLSKYDVRYVILTSDMEHDLVWESPGRGLSFLATNNPLFELIIEVDDVRVYRVIS